MRAVRVAAAALVLQLVACAHTPTAEEASGMANKAFEAYHQAFTAWYVAKQERIETQVEYEKLLKVRTDWEEIEDGFHVALGALELAAQGGNVDLEAITKWTERAIAFLRKHDVPIPEVP